MRFVDYLRTGVRTLCDSGELIMQRTPAPCCIGEPLVGPSGVRFVAQGQGFSERGWASSAAQVPVAA